MSLFRKSLILLVLVIAGLIIGQIALTGLMYAGGADLMEAGDVSKLIESMDSTVPFKIGVCINNILMFAVSAYLFNLIVFKEKFTSYFALEKGINGGWFVLSVLLMISIYPLIAYSAQLMQQIELPDWAQSMDASSYETLASVLEMNGPTDLLLNLFVVAITPAIGEELLFRGVIQKELNRHLRNPHVGIVLTSIIFSAIHMSVEGFPARLLLGIVLGYSYHFTKNLWYPILLHLFNNGLQVLALYISGENVKELDPTEGPEIHWAFALVSLLAAIIIFTLLKTKSEKDVISA